MDILLLDKAVMRWTSWGIMFWCFIECSNLITAICAVILYDDFHFIIKKIQLKYVTTELDIATFSNCPGPKPLLPNLLL